MRASNTAVRINPAAMAKLRELAKPSGVPLSVLGTHLVEQYAAGLSPGPGARHEEILAVVDRLLGSIGEHPPKWERGSLGKPVPGDVAVHDVGQDREFAVAWVEGGEWIAAPVTVHSLRAGAFAQVVDGRLVTFCNRGMVRRQGTKSTEGERDEPKESHRGI